VTQVLNGLLDVPYHHLVMSIPWQLRIVIIMNRWEGLNLLVRAGCEAIQQWARDTKGMRMGILAVIHTSGSDMKWHPHIHLIVTAGGLSLDGSRWIATDPRFLMHHFLMHHFLMHHFLMHHFLMHHAGLKKRWKYQVTTGMKKSHREGQWRFPKSKSFLKQYPNFAAILNKLWHVTWYAHIGASLLDPRFSVQYIGRYTKRAVMAEYRIRYTKRAVMAEYRIRYYDGKLVRFSFKDYAKDGKTSYMTLKVKTFIGRIIRHIPDKHFPMIRYAGIFCNRWKHRYLSEARSALNQTHVQEKKPTETWAERQTHYTGTDPLTYTGTDPLTCPKCDIKLTFVGHFFGDWEKIKDHFDRAGLDAKIAACLMRPG